MRVLARVEELTTAALQARLVQCQQLLALSGLRPKHRAQVERQHSCVSKVLQQRERQEGAS
jgi:hypothetical protein